MPQSTIRFGRQGLARTDPDFIAATVVNHVLGGGVFSARLFREVREKRGLAYSVYSQLADLRSRRDAARRHLDQERARRRIAGGDRSRDRQASPSEGPTEEELDKAKKYLIGSYALRFDTSTKIAAHLVQLQIDGYGVDYLDERNATDRRGDDGRRQARGQAPVRRREPAGDDRGPARRDVRRRAGGEPAPAALQALLVGALFEVAAQTVKQLLSLVVVSAFRDFLIGEIIAYVERGLLR